MNHFLQELKGRYGEVGLKMDIKRWRERFKKSADEIIYGGHISQSQPKPLNPQPPPKPQSQPKPPVIVRSQNKFSPVNIATIDDWRELRNAALNLNELEIFFMNKSDLQSPMFRNLIREYKRAVEKNLMPPDKINAASSSNFVEKIAHALKDKFLTMLETCRRGKAGSGKNPAYYYVQIETRIKKYFERIGLQIDDVAAGTNFQDVQNHMRISTTIETDSFQDGDKIAEVLIPPSYFKYHDDSGEILEYWIDGKCTVYKRNKFSPVNIATLDDWLKLRDKALNLDELENFFAGRIDSQSPMFLSLIKEYKRAVERNLKPPDEIDEESSYNFVEKISSALENKFLTMVESCRKGKAGNGKNPAYYYVQIEQLMKKYFERISLQVEDVKPGSNFRDVRDHMKVSTTIEARYEQDCDKIAEVFIPPSYFKYHDDSGEVLEYWIDGKCTVYQRGGA